MEGLVVAPQAEVARIGARRILRIHLALAHAAVLKERLLGGAEKGVLERLVTESDVAMLEPLFDVIVGPEDRAGGLVGGLHVAHGAVLAVSRLVNRHVLSILDAHPIKLLVQELLQVGVSGELPFYELGLGRRVQGRIDALPNVDLVEIGPGVLLSARACLVELVAECALVGGDRGRALVAEVEVMPGQLLLSLIDATAVRGAGVGDPLAVLLVVARRLVRYLRVSHGVVMATHHLVVIHHLKPVLALHLVLSLLVGQLGDGVDYRAGAGRTDLPVRI